jgi:hypothetical protein
MAVYYVPPGEYAPFPDAYVTAVIHGTRDVPQGVAGVALHMGNLHMRHVVDGEQTWDNFVFSDLSQEQYDRLGRAAAHDHKANRIAAGYFDSQGHIQPRTDKRLRLFSTDELAAGIGNGSMLILQAACRYAKQMVHPGVIDSIEGAASYGIPGMPRNSRRLLRSLESGEARREAAGLSRLWSLAAGALAGESGTAICNALRQRLSGLQGDRHLINRAVNEAAAQLRPVIADNIRGARYIVDITLGRPIPDDVVERFVATLTRPLDNP